MGHMVMDIFMWIIIASLVVLVVMNPKGFSTDVSSVGGFVTTESTVLTGSGYGNSGYGKMN